MSVPGKAPYDIDCAICAAGISQGQVVHVAVSAHNKHRVTIDVGQGSKGGDRRPRPVTDASTMSQGYQAGTRDFASDLGATGAGRTASESERLSQLAQLGKLHSEGVLTDAEFAAQKAQILGE